MVLRPPESLMKNEAEYTAWPHQASDGGHAELSAGLNGKPRFSIYTVIMPHMPHTASRPPG